ncbi:MAG: hypothetical protein AAB539_02335 [Patescibacteria group bacterium]
MKWGICKLCLQEKNLCRESHIIPKFHYKFLYGQNHHLVLLNSERKEDKHNSEYEGNILCQLCEHETLGKLDNYAARLIDDLFTTQRFFRSEQIDGRDFLVIENNPEYDYQRLKLFLLSLLWRASISSRPFFQTIKLDHKIEEDIRLMVLKSDPGEPSKYSCFINLPPFSILSNGERVFSTLHMPVRSPRHIKKDEFEAYEFVIEGVHYYFLISHPKTRNVVPGVGKKKLSIGFARIQDQEELIWESIQMIRNFKSKMR